MLRINLDLARNGSASVLVEQLRYAGILTDVKHEYRNDEDEHGVLSFTLHAPKNVRKSAWEKMNSERMASFGIRATPC